MSRAEASELRRALAQRQQRLAEAYGQGQGRPGPGEHQGGGARGTAGRGRVQIEEGQQGAGQQGPPGGAGESKEGHASRQVGGGAVARGGGSSELVFGEAARIDPDRLKFAPLPRGNGGDEQQLWGLSAADPRPREAHAVGGATGQLSGSDPAVGYKEGPKLPRNRELIRRYFDAPRP